MRVSCFLLRTLCSFLLTSTAIFFSRDLIRLQLKIIGLVCQAYLWVVFVALPRYYWWWISRLLGEMSGLSKDASEKHLLLVLLVPAKMLWMFLPVFVGFELVWSGNSRQAFAVRDRNFTSTYERICRVIWQQWASEIHHWALGHSAFLTKGSHLVSLDIMMFHKENFTSWATSCFLTNLQ